MEAGSPVGSAARRRTVAAGTVLRRVAHRAGLDAVVDGRALAALRIALGALLLIDLAYRVNGLEAFHAGSGALPPRVLREVTPLASWLTFHAWAPNAPVAAIGLALEAAGAAALLAGFRTRLATAWCFVFHASLMARNPFMLNAGDTLLAGLLFWGMLLPLDARAAWDRRGLPGLEARGDLATVGIMVHVALVYTTNAVFKWRAPGWRDGSSLGIVFQLDRYTTALGDAVGKWPDAMGPLGIGWLLLLTAAPLLFVRRLRPWLVAAFSVAHVTMLLTMRLGIFPLVSLAALLPFVPSPAWDAASRRAARVAQRLRRTPSSGGPASGPDAAAGQDGGGAGVPQRARGGSPARSGVAGAALAALLLWGGLGLGFVPAPAALAGVVEQYGRGWAMFDVVEPIDSWYLAPADLESGRVVDALFGDRVAWDHPRQPGWFPDIRWRAYLAEASADPRLAEPLAQHLCARWNAAHDDPVVAVALIRMERPIGGSPRPHLVLAHECRA